MHAFIYSDAAHVVHARLSNGRTASFPQPLAWLTAISWATEAGAVTIETRT